MGGSDTCNCLVELDSLKHHSAEISALVLCCSFQTSYIILEMCLKMRDFKGPDILSEAENSSEERFVGSFKPRPPKHVGRKNSLHFKSLGGSLPVRAGINLHLNIASSRRCSNTDIWGTTMKICPTVCQAFGENSISDVWLCFLK